MSHNPNFSPISTHQQRKQATTSSLRKSSQLNPAESSSKPKYVCPGCHEVFLKWSPCLSHLRDKKHAAIELLDKKLNGGDFRRVQELCATLAYHQRGGGNGGPSTGRERTDSNSSIESLSSDSGGEEDDNNSPLIQTPLMVVKKSGLRSRYFPTISSSLSTSSSSRLGSIHKQILKNRLDIRSFNERVRFRILGFLDTTSAQSFFWAINDIPERTSSPTQSRVRLWSVSSDQDSLPSTTSPPAVSNRKSVILGKKM